MVLQMRLPVHGQGVIFFKVPATAEAIVRILAPDASGLQFQFTTDAVLASRIGGEPLVDPANKSGLVTHAGVYYWISLDSQNQRICVGVGEARVSTMIYNYQWNLADGDRKANKLFLESLVTVEASLDVKLLRVLRDPITGSIPLKVKGTDALTMDDVASGAFLPKANLSAMAQKLYDCIAGPQFMLDSPDFPEFSQAIEYSIATPGCWCWQRLKEKSREFNPDKPDPTETYLRITLGQNNGESPGIPYVMEIWPVGHYSPIHNHGGAEAIIRVLHGGIHVSLYPYLCAEKDGVPPFAETDFAKGDITWISSTLNQTHKLTNLAENTDTCITIQCYMYDAQNRAHYDYFDYLDTDGKQQQYEPDSDMDFVAFKELMRKEWAARPRRRRCWP